MKNTTKKRILASLCVVSLAGSSMCFLSSISASAEINDPYTSDGIYGYEFDTCNTIFYHYGLNITCSIEYDGVFCTRSMPFIPFIPERLAPDHDYYWMDGSISNSVEDYPFFSSNALMYFATSGNEPTFENDGGIIDDGYIDGWATHGFQYAPITDGGGDLGWQLTIGFEEAQPCDINELVRLLSTVTYSYYTTGNYVSWWGWLSFDVLDVNSDGDFAWVNVNIPFDDFQLDPIYAYIDSLSYVHVDDYVIVKNFQLTSNNRYTHLDSVDDISTIQLGLGADGVAVRFADYTDFDESPTLAQFFDEYKTINIDPPPTDILYSPVIAFLDTEFFPGFTFGGLLLISLGIMTFGLFLKLYMGG